MRRVRPAVAGVLGSLLASAPAPPGRAAFERLPVGPEAAALGGILAVSPDPVFGNPASAVAVAPIPGSGPESRASGVAGLEVRLWRSRPFGIPELVETQAGVARTGSRAGAGFGARRFGSSAYVEKELRAIGSWAPVPGLALGVAARGLSVGGSAWGPRRGFAVDVGLRARPEPETVLGAVAEAVLGRVPGDVAGRLRRTSLGASRGLPGRFRVHLEVQRREDRALSGVVGLSWTPHPTLTLRAGAREDPPALAWGFSLRVPAATLAGSVIQVDPLGRTVRVGLTLRSIAPPDPPPRASRDRSSRSGAGRS